MFIYLIFTARTPSILEDWLCNLFIKKCQRTFQVSEKKQELNKKSQRLVSAFSEPSFALRSLAWSVLGFQHAFSSNGFASNVFIFATSWSRLAFHNFLFISSRAKRSHSCNNESCLKKSSIDLVRFVDEKGKKGKYHKNYTRLYPALPTQSCCTIDD